MRKMQQEQTAEMAGFSPKGHLISVAARIWANEGRAAVTTRSLVNASGIPNSGIYRHFDGMEQLFHEVQTSWIAYARHWCEQFTTVLSRAPQSAPDAFSAIFAAIVEEWTQFHRETLLGWHECHLLAARDAHFLPELGEWYRLWLEFWKMLCARCGLEGMGEVCVSMFSIHSQIHLLQWDRAIDRACLDEFARGLGAWLTGNLAAEETWLSFARIEAKRKQDRQERPDMVRYIAQAAVRVLERSGMGGLTHRAVAAEAGLTLGTVSYNFRTIADLAQATFEELLDQIVPPMTDADTPPTAAAVAAYRKSTPLLLSVEELILEAARNPALSEFAPQLRYLRGSSGRLRLASALGRNDVSALDGLLYSSLLTGTGRTTMVLSPDEVRAAEAISNIILSRLKNS